MSKKVYYSILLFLLFFLIYYIGSFSRIPFADSVDFVLLAEKGKYMQTATATTHFLYTNTVIFIKNITGLNAIEASRLLIICCAAATVAIVYLTVKVLVKSDWVSIMAAFIFGFSFTFWKNTEIVEVYTYNTLWISLFFFCIIKTFQSKESKYIVLSAVFLGVSLWLHIQNILLIPAFLLFLFYFKTEKKSVYSSLFTFVAIFASMFILNSLSGLPLNSPFSTDRGHWIEDTFKKNPTQCIQDLLKSVIYLLYNFNLFTVFGIIGIISLYKTNRKMFYVFFVGSLCVYGFSTFYAVSDNYVFFIPFNLIFALSIGYGISLSFTKYPLIKKLSWVCLLIPVFYFLSFKMVMSTSRGKEFHSFKSYKGGLNYYMLPWMNNNVGILEFTVDKKTAPEPMSWMTESAEGYIKELKRKGYTSEEIKKL
ncbi:protein O-mannosyl-transferase family [Chryseobacterium limigenitum]|uniref:Dolichyl-phosphate-mannose-protein mannosyltransferase n=1 Tax=Chryseobacterium limigenitum TaxID=1612149 RepID=A0A1K2IWC1_9FLAO|nr:DUF2723 domain-containing protein [Chryseobacterium limigenitum]SFZ96737.1 Protein of unknown function [Chryseobacterium limigenitum]